MSSGVGASAVDQGQIMERGNSLQPVNTIWVPERGTFAYAGYPAYRISTGTEDFRILLFFLKRTKKDKKKLFRFLFRSFEGLDKDNLFDSLDQFKAFVDDPAAPEQPAPVVVDAGRQGDGCLVAVHCNLHVPAGI
jgi:hypothetical protein